MSDPLLPYYHRELAFIRRMGAEFAGEHPEVAAGLRLGPDACEDPHVERMIMAFAYLTARIRAKLDDDFPEVAGALLGALYPHYQAPIPSMAVVEMKLDREQSTLAAGYRVERGRTVETETVGGEPCRFRTAYPVTLWPIEVAAARLTGLPAGDAALKIELRCFSKEMTFARLDLPRLRFFLNGQPQHAHLLYELLLNESREVTLARSGGPHPPVTLRLGKECLSAVGFGEEEELLPYPARSFPGYRLISEYFAFPEKFRFFDLSGLSPAVLAGVGQKLELTISLGRSSADLEQNVSADTFRLGCTPVVNLFRQRAEPIRLTHTETEYRVVPDARRTLATEVYSIDRVVATSPDGEAVEHHPFYSLKHSLPRDGRQAFWTSTRRASSRASGQADHGTEVFLSLVDLELDPQAPADWTVDVETTCLNRDLPRRLPFGGGQPALSLTDAGSSIVKPACLTPPTPTLRPPSGNGAWWRLISHLSLNHLSIAFGEGDGGEGSPEALREILKLYDFADSPETRSKIAGVLAVRGRPAVGRVGDGAPGFVRGVEVNVQFDEERFSDAGLFLFASVLERFLGLYASVNSFTQLVLTTKQRKGIIRRWPPRAAQRTLV